MSNGTLLFVDLYQTEAPTGWAKLLQRSRPQRWRWRALNGNNFRVLAVSSESYTNYGDARGAVFELFGDKSNVYLREAEHGDYELRLAA